MKKRLSYKYCRGYILEMSTPENVAEEITDSVMKRLAKQTTRAGVGGKTVFPNEPLASFYRQYEEQTKHDPDLPIAMYQAIISSVAEMMARNNQALLYLIHPPDAKK